MGYPPAVLAAALTTVFLPDARTFQTFQASDYVRTEHRIKARDGVELFTVTFAPRNANGPLPVLMTRTPYNAGSEGIGSPYLSEFVRDGYVFCFQDVRGHYGSGGTFVMQRPMRDPRVKGAVDEATDAYDTVDWLVKKLPGTNGKVGMLGISYDGWTALVAGLDPHPALKAVSPQAAPVDMWENDDFHRNGAFRLSYGFEYAFSMESQRGFTPFDFKAADMYDWYLRLGPLSNVDGRYFKGQIPTWTDFVEHPDHDRYWLDRSAVSWMKKPKIPFLFVGGWWDQEDPIGPYTAYHTLSKNDPDGLVRLALGPWNHGGWAGKGDVLGPFSFGSDTGATFRADVQKPFFDHYLKEQVTKLDRCTVFRTGANAWQKYDQWPPKKKDRNATLYLQSGGLALFDPPKTGGYDEFVSDPAKPVPYRTRPIEPHYANGSRWWSWMVEDQRFVDGRPDVLTWLTEPLKDPVTLTGDAFARLFASTSGTDSDWIVKLIDVYPDTVKGQPKLGGYQLMVRSEVVRARYRNGGAKAVPVPAGKPLKYDVDLHWIDHTFARGHRIMVQVQSTWFPLIDRNPQTFVPNIFKAKPTDFHKATQRVFQSKAMPSRIEVASG